MGHSCGTLEAVLRAFRTRRPPKVPKRQVSKTSASNETSSKSHASSLQNERFLRDFLKRHVSSLQNCVSYETSSKTHMSKSTKTSISYETSSKSQAETPIGARSPAKQFRESSPSKQYPLTRQSQCDSDIHLYHNSRPHDSLRCHESFRIHTSNAHKVLRLPRNVTSVTPHNLTISCACHESRTSTPQNPHKVLRLPRKVTISSHVSFNKICTTPHVWNDFDPFWAHSHPPKSPFQLRFVTKTELRCHTLKRKSQWHGHIQHPKKHDSPNANPNAANCGSHKMLRLRSEMHHASCATCHFHANHDGIASQTDT